MIGGKFLVSLDFELMWGVRDKKEKSNYGENILGVHEVIPKLLDVFRKYDIRATFSSVGLLFFENKQELLASIPSLKPQYLDAILSPYNGHFTLVGDNHKVDKYHYAPNLIREIQKYPGQEIGTHTFCHYYCLERGQNIEAFRADVQAATNIAKKFNIDIKSLIFPRNQFNDEYLKVCAEFGISCFRGNEHSWLYEAKNGEAESMFRRAFRLFDAYVNISGHHCYDHNSVNVQIPIDMPSSRFLRPFSHKLRVLEGLRLHRIKTGMTHAAINNLTYHLWWHPHNFGVNQNENFLFLKKVLDHYQFLHTKYNFQSHTMSDLAKILINEG